MKVSELTGAKLDYWAAKAKKYRSHHNEEIIWNETRMGSLNPITGTIYNVNFSPSTNWNDGGPIIEREGIELVPGANGEQWAAGIEGFISGGDTPLIAAMRCFVASKFGEDVPDE